jgi:hypothetical protein
MESYVTTYCISRNINSPPPRLERSASSQFNYRAAGGLDKLAACGCILAGAGRPHQGIVRGGAHAIAENIVAK